MQSKSYEIATLTLASGAIGIAPMPGTQQGFDLDFLVLREWRPRLVISMTQTSEMDDHGAAHLPTMLEQFGIAWLHLPVQDYGVPEGLAWPEVREQILSVLSDGGRVLVHCRGGCGRSGMLILRLMIATGEAPDAALARLRAVRPCAVETEAQLAWAAQG